MSSESTFSTNTLKQNTFSNFKIRMLTVSNFEGLNLLSSHASVIPYIVNHYFSHKSPGLLFPWNNLAHLAVSNLYTDERTFPRSNIFLSVNVCLLADYVLQTWTTPKTMLCCTSLFYHIVDRYHSTDIYLFL